MVAPLCYCLLILPEMLGFGNIWGVLLKDRFMNVASRLSFSSYTIYYGVCMTIINSLEEDLYVNFSKLLCLWTGSILVSLGFGFLLCGLLEIPLYRILHTCLGRSSPKAYIEFYWASYDISIFHKYAVAYDNINYSNGRKIIKAKPVTRPIETARVLQAQPTRQQNKNNRKPS